jgi:hypothetical protein
MREMCCSETPKTASETLKMRLGDVKCAAWKQKCDAQIFHHDRSASPNQTGQYPANLIRAACRSICGEACFAE